eukprot:UN23989
MLLCLITSKKKSVSYDAGKSPCLFILKNSFFLEFCL